MPTTILTIGFTSPPKRVEGILLSEEQTAYNRPLRSYRLVVEHTIAQLNKFGVFSQVDRPARDSHSQTMRVVGGLVNRQMEVTPLKSYPVA